MEKNKLAAIIGAVAGYMQQEEQTRMAAPGVARRPELSPWRLFHLQETMRRRNVLRLRKSKF